jgi:UPF0042 nucleotide-binding protein
VALRVLLVSGLSGSGKTTAVNALEDLGYFCVDNLPLQLLGPLLELPNRAAMGGPGVAVVMDSRGGDFLPGLGEALKQVREHGHQPEILFLTTSDDVLQRRFNETRRRHPLTEEDGTAAAIQRDRQMLEPLRVQAHRVIDTTHLNVHDLRRAVRKSFGGGQGLPLRLQSFGFKHGAPRDANLVMDVRFLPNPYFDETLRARDGRDDEVAAYALSSPEAEEFLDRWAEIVEFLLPHYEAEGKPTLSVAVGCTGGQHRSVAVIEWLARRLREGERAVSVEHRDAGRNG